MGTEFWAGHVAAATRETVSASEYARRHGISVVLAAHAENHHRQSAKKVSTPAKPAHASSFVELRVLDKPLVPPCLCTLVLPSELRLEMSALPEPSWLVALGYAMQGAR